MRMIFITYCLSLCLLLFTIENLNLEVVLNSGLRYFFFRLHPRHPEEGQGREAAAHTALAAQASPAGA